MTTAQEFVLHIAETLAQVSDSGLRVLDATPHWGALHADPAGSSYIVHYGLYRLFTATYENGQRMLIIEGVPVVDTPAHTETWWFIYSCQPLVPRVRWITLTNGIPESMRERNMSRALRRAVERLRQTIIARCSGGQN